MNEDITLLAALTQCFEKDETIDGYHIRTVPFRTEETAAERFATWRTEIARWLGSPEGEDGGVGRQRVWWPDLRMKRSGRGVTLWIRSARVDDWWHNSNLSREPGLDGLWKWDT